ncbi:MICAL-like protein 1 isoform X2 [Diachasma alloeum]|nr:MICAL-like protein 1 isoform X2 [Diachasma alloeum]XP_015111428.1 MICAL-like protein 1 isoform X2 [Diachasma alloeum]XP_015111429.1 MICAL-like protein 1 isoform X2 [Diachasma alloeum]
MPRLGMRRELCAVCALPVFLAEKLVITRRTYHRTCFKCARCTNQLTPGNFYETEEGDFCCETCPDEDKSTPLSSPPSTALSTPSIPSTPLPTPRSLSDEEKTKKIHENPSKTTRMRLDFMSHQLESSTVDSVPAHPPPPIPHDSTIIESPGECCQPPRDNLPPNFNDNNEVDVTSVELNVDDVIVCKDTKETLGVDNDDDDVDEASQCLSVVQKRLKLFERIGVDEVLSRNNSLREADNDVDKQVDDDDCVEPDSLDLLESSRDVEEVEVDKVDKIKHLDNPQDDDKNKDVGLLNAEGIDLSVEYPEDMNPFHSDDDDNEIDTQEVLKTPKVSTNPFGSSEDDEEEKVPTPAARRRTDSTEPVKRRLQAPHINLNPFWSDDEEGESDGEAPKVIPVPKPRTIRDIPGNLERAGLYASSSSLASSSSTTTTPGGTYRKRKPAPPPPVGNERVSTSISDIKSPQSSNNSPVKTPRPRKSKPAPPPPLPTSLLSTLSLTSPPSWEEEKISKNQSNKSKQSQRSPAPVDDDDSFSYSDKSTQGKWKRKKGPAPARPVPQRRKIKVMSMKDVKLELDEIEMQQQGLERQGVRLEQLIRDRCENDHDNEPPRDDNMTMDVEELVLELFSLVNEKNELFRRQAELMLLKRQQRLEEEHADIEYQIRCLMCQPEATKTDFDKQREEKLIQRLVEIVERRSEIVECLEMDRRREVEEDKSINMHMGLYAAKSKGDLTKDLEFSPKPQKSKKLKIKGTILDKHLKKIHKKDADKDVDETEVKLKRQNKKKWF